jgi:hypothetical protein
MTPAERVIVHLDGVRETGQGRWIAKCPAHDDRSPSLSVRETADGTVLLNCFGSCGTGDVLAALGLSMQDLFDNPPLSRGPNRPGERRQSARESLEILRRDSCIVLVAAEMLAKGNTLTPDDIQSLAAATVRIQTIGGTS